jgi:hypothetical protein
MKKMKHINTIKRYVSGSDKFFDIYECTVDEVDEITDSKDRKMLQITVGDVTYKGLHSKRVADFLYANEGQPSFIALWKSPKAEYMLAYAWDVWQDHLDGKNTVKEKPLDEPAESFVYMWIDTKTDKKYIGKHKGTADDGYVCSSESMIKEYNERKDDFVRTILAYGDDEAMLHLETILLLQLNTTKRHDFFNYSNNLRS